MSEEIIDDNVTPAAAAVPGIDVERYRDRIGTVEQCGIEYIPEEVRKSHPRNLFSILCGGSLTFSVIIIGWFPISFGLGFWQAASAVVIGSAIGAALLAPMGLMGPRTGTNNPVSSGAYFGVAGRIVGSVLEASASLAFAALSIWTGGDALAGALARFFDVTNDGPMRLVAYGILSVVVAAVSVLGHANMVAAQRFMIPTAGACMVIGIFVYLPDFDAGYGGTRDYMLGSATSAWLLSVLLCASTVASYGPYVGDWTRHISPRAHDDRSIMRALFLGGMFGMGGPFMWGTITAAAVFATGVGGDQPYVLALVAAAPIWFVPALVYLGLASGTAQAVINTYGTGLDTSAIIPRLSRVQATVIACTCSALLVYLGYFDASIAEGVSVFLQMLACFSLPWIIMMAIGHFQRRGYYDPDALQVFNRGQRGGIYWFSRGVNPRGMLTWALASGGGLLFASNSWFTGPGSDLVGGADVGFLVAAIIAAIGYPVVLRAFPEPTEVLGPVPDAQRTPIIG